MITFDRKSLIENRNKKTKDGVEYGKTTPKVWVITYYYENEKRQRVEKVANICSFSYEQAVKSIRNSCKPFEVSILSYSKVIGRIDYFVDEVVKSIRDGGYLRQVKKQESKIDNKGL